MLPAWFVEVLAPVVAIGAILALWEIAVRSSGAPVYILPAPGLVLARIWAAPSFYWQEGLVTILEALTGLVLGGSLAAAAGLCMAAWRTLERALLPLAILVKVTPIVVIAPVFIIWFGFGPLPKVLVAALISFFPLLIGTLAGIRATEPEQLGLARVLGGSQADLLVHVQIPAALPHLFAALRVSLPLSLIGAVVGEWVGADRGLGRAVLIAHTNLDLPGLFAGVVCLAAAGATLNAVLAVVEARVLHWHGERRR